MKPSHLAIGFAAIVAIVSAGAAVALPAQWDPFLECSKSFVPVSRPARPMETVVAERVVTTCIRTQQPSMPSITTAIDDIRPGAGNVTTIADTPCPKIPDVVAGLKSKITEYSAAISQIDAAIAAGNEAQQIIGGTISTLKSDSARRDSVCARATGRYEAVHNNKVAELRRICQRMSPANRVDCLDGIETEANIAPSVWPAFEDMNMKCAAADEAQSTLQDAKATSEKFKADLIKLQAERQALNISKIRAQRLMNTLNRELANCPSP